MRRPNSDEAGQAGQGGGAPSDNGDEARARRPRYRLLLIAILLVSAGVRFWALDFGLPHTRARPDETKIVRILESPWQEFHPRTFAYPSLFKYTVLGANAVYYGVGRALGRFDRVQDLLAEYVIDPYGVYLVARICAALLGTATVLALFHVGRRVGGERVGLLAALFLGLSFLHGRDSHFAVTDVPMTFLVVLSLLCVLRSQASGKLRDYVLAGLFCGLATSAKYSGAFLAAPMLAAHLRVAWGERPGIRRALLDRRLPAFALVAAAAFFAGTPYALLDATRFLQDVARDAHHLATGHGMVLDRGWWYHPRVSLPAALGWPLFVVSLGGLVFLATRYRGRGGMGATRWTGVVLLAFPLAYYAVAGSGYAVFLRYTMPLLPFLCLASAVLVDDVARRFARVPGSAIVLVGVLLVLPSASRLVQADRLLGQRDNRLVATDWVLEHVPSGSSIHQTGSRSARLQLPRTFDALERDFAVLTQEWGRGWLAASAPGRARGEVRGYDEWTYDADADRFVGEGARRSSNPDFVFVIESALPRYEKDLAAALRARLERDYRLERSFVAIDLARGDQRFDPIDALYLPYAGFGGVERPGPNVHVYARADAVPGGGAQR